jgi:hypothetical protein
MNEGSDHGMVLSGNCLKVFVWRAEAAKGRIHWRGPTVFLVFRLQLYGGPYIPIIMRGTKICRLRLVTQR